MGYNLVVNPSKLSMNKALFERETSQQIEWFEHPLSYKSIVALANDELDMTVANSVDIARAFSRKLPVKLVWVVEELWNTEGLFVHNDFHVVFGGPVRTPLNLKGMKIGVTLGGTEHYALEAYFKEMQVDMITNSLYQLRGCNYIGPPQCHQKPLPNNTNTTQCKMLEPCHYEEQKNNTVHFIGMQRHELREAWDKKEIHAVYAGWQEIDFYQENNGYLLMSTQELTNWGKSLFNGLLVSDKFLARTDLNPWNVTAATILTYAKAHYYYVNNTKEFMELYAGKESVSARIEAVADYPMAGVANKLRLLRIPTMEDQVSCRYFGCGIHGGLAKALKDQARFCTQIKIDQNPEKVLQQELFSVQLADMMDDYTPWITSFYTQTLLDQGTNASYFLAIGDRIHLGYQITANYGRTTSLITT